MSLVAFPTLLKKLKNNKYREAYVSANVRHGIAYQIRSIREQRKWSQSDLGARVKTRQNVISRLENPSYGQATVQTLLNLASAFDVALIIRFVKFEEFIKRTSDVSPGSFEVPSFDEELSHSVSADNLSEGIKESFVSLSGNHKMIDKELSSTALSKTTRGALPSNCNRSNKDDDYETALGSSQPSRSLSAVGMRSQHEAREH